MSHIKFGKVLPWVMHMVLSIAHSTVFHGSISAMFSSNKIRDDITETPTYHTDPALLMHSTVSAYRPNRPYLPCSVHITTNTKDTCVSGSEMTQDVGMVCESVVVSFLSSLVGL